MSEPRRTGQYVEERNFFRERCLHPDHTWVGASSDALLRYAVEGGAQPDRWPLDEGDLDRCRQTVERAPEHLAVEMRPWLARFERNVKFRSATTEFHAAHAYLYGELLAGAPTDFLVGLRAWIASAPQDDLAREAVACLDAELTHRPREDTPA